MWLALSTSYRVDENELVIRAGPFSWRIERASISNIARSRSVLSAPALSLDRLEITYGNGQSILVSPQDKDGFIKALENS